MGIFRWRGDGAGTKTAWNDGRNWIDETGAAYTVGVYPGSTVGTHDDALFDAALTGTQQAMTGYNGAALETLASLRVSADYDGVFGDAAAHLNVPATLAIIDGEAVSGTAYLDGCNIETLIVTAGTLALGGDVLNAYFLKGTISASCSWGIGGTLVVGYEALATDCTLTIPTTGVAPIEPVHVYGGTLTANVDVPNLVQSAGTVNLYAGCSVQALVAGGVCNWYGGDIDTLLSYGGSFVSLARTMQTITKLVAGKGATVNLDNGVGTLTVTDTLALGGTITQPVGV